MAAPANKYARLEDAEGRFQRLLLCPREVSSAESLRPERLSGPQPVCSPDGPGPRTKATECQVWVPPTCRRQCNVVGQTLQWPGPTGAPDTGQVLGEDQLDYDHCHHYSAGKRQHTALPPHLLLGFPRFSLLVVNLGLKVLSGKSSK